MSLLARCKLAGASLSRPRVGSCQHQSTTGFPGRAGFARPLKSRPEEQGQAGQARRLRLPELAQLPPSTSRLNVCKSRTSLLLCWTDKGICSTAQLATFRITSPRFVSSCFTAQRFLLQYALQSPSLSTPRPSI